MSASPSTCGGFDRWTAARADDEWWHDHEERWHAFASTQSPDGFAAARRSATRAAALLGALPDGLTLEDRALSRAVAWEEGGWRALLDGLTAGLGAAFARQLDTYRLVELRALSGAPPDQALVKLLHELVCGGQATYLVSDRGRLIRRPLARGRYKCRANQSHCEVGESRYVAPGAVDQAMRRFVAVLTTDAFASAHPAVQTAYTLHTLLAIHPFTDGNGRVARALASIPLYRALSLPFFVESGERRVYLDALRAADRGDVQQLVAFVVRRCGETVSFALAGAEARSRHA